MATRSLKSHFAAPLLVLLIAALPLTSCQSDAEKAAEYLANAEAAAEQGQHNAAMIEFRNALRVDPNLAAAHYGLGRAYFKLGRASQAYWEFQEAVRLGASDPKARLTLGQLALLARDGEKALEQAQVMIELAPDDADAHALHAQALELLDRMDEAEAAYLAVIEKEPEEGEHLLLIAGYYERRGDREAAHSMLVKFTEVDPGVLSYSSLARFLAADPERDEAAVQTFTKALEFAKGRDRVITYLRLAALHSKHGRLGAAAEVLQAGIDSVEDDPDGGLELVYALAQLQHRRGDEQAALALIESTVSESPNDVRPYLILSKYQDQRGDLEGSLATTERALAVDPSHPLALLRKAELLVEIGYRSGNASGIEESRAIVAGVLDREPTSPEALLVLGKIAYAENDAQAAVEALQAAVESRPDWAAAYFALGSALERSGEMRRARAQVARALELDPELLAARRLLAQVHASLGEYGYAAEQGRIYLRQRPGDRAMRLLVAQSLGRIGRHDEAIETIDLIPEERWDAPVLLARGSLLLASGEPERAREMLLRANETNPYDPHTLRLLLRVDGLLGELDASGARIDQALAARPDDGELMRLKGSYAMRRGDLKTAEEAFERAIELNPDDALAYQRLAGLYQASGRLNEAHETFERALAKRPDSAQLHYFVAVLSAMRGDTERAIRGYERAIELDEGMAEAKNNLAYLLAESGSDLFRALNLAQEAKALMPESPVAADTLGWVLYKRGLASAAADYFQEAAANLDPSAPELGIVRHHLAQAYEAADERELAIESLELALAELELQQGEIRKRGGTPRDPGWAGPARAMLSRLTQAG